MLHSLLNSGVLSRRQKSACFFWFICFTDQRSTCLTQGWVSNLNSPFLRNCDCSTMNRNLALNAQSDSLFCSPILYSDNVSLQTYSLILLCIVLWESLKRTTVFSTDTLKNFSLLCWNDIVFFPSWKGDHALQMNVFKYYYCMDVVYCSGNSMTKLAPNPSLIVIVRYLSPGISSIRCDENTDVGTGQLRSNHAWVQKGRKAVF